VSELAASLLRRLHPVNPYVDFPLAEFPQDLQGGSDDGFLAKLINEPQARILIEVGCWKGANAIRMASLLKQQGADAAVICVDTWLGSVEHWEGSVRGWDIRPFLRNGYPRLYYQFLANVLHGGCEQLIVPLPNTSSNTAHWLQRQRIAADFIYIDGSHEEEDVYHDLCSYWKLLKPGGVLAGDDWHAHWYGVICAVNRFVRERELPLRIAGQKWVIQKPKPRPKA
jgi:predicted O-methyltransferase YrrM